MVMLRSTIATTLLCAVLCGAVAGGAEYTYTYPPCAEGISCYTITTSAELTFDCGYVVNASNSISSKGFVYHMHGNDGLQSKAMFFDTMRQLGEVGYNSLACDARGYSPGAAPMHRAAPCSPRSRQLSPTGARHVADRDASAARAPTGPLHTHIS